MEARDKQYVKRRQKASYRLCLRTLRGQEEEQEAHRFRKGYF
jgi:hypothetical protein